MGKTLVRRIARDAGISICIVSALSAPVGFLALSHIIPSYVAWILVGFMANALGLYWIALLAAIRAAGIMKV